MGDPLVGTTTAPALALRAIPLITSCFRTFIPLLTCFTLVMEHFGQLFHNEIIIFPMFQCRGKIIKNRSWLFLGQRLTSSRLSRLPFSRASQQGFVVSW